jgi:hypothetical protein
VLLGWVVRVRGCVYACVRVVGGGVLEGRIGRLLGVIVRVGA